jgi:hypothetical protein
MASPHVAGVAALIKSCNSALTAAQIGQIIRETARPLREAPGDPVPNQSFGFGLVDAAAAVARACPRPLPILTTLPRTNLIRCCGFPPLTQLPLTQVIRCCFVPVTQPVTRPVQCCFTPSAPVTRPVQCCFTPSAPVTRPIQCCFIEPITSSCHIDPGPIQPGLSADPYGWGFDPYGEGTGSGPGWDLYGFDPYGNPCD